MRHNIMVQCIICNTDGSSSKERQYVKIARRQADGIVFLSQAKACDYLRKLANEKYRLVADRYIED